MGSGTDLKLNQILVMIKLENSNERHNKNNGIFNEQIWKTVMAVGIWEINP